MGRMLVISPFKLFRHSFVGGTILVLAVLLLGVDIAIVSLRAHYFSVVQRWMELDSIGGLDNIAYSLLVSILFTAMLIFLLLDLVATLLLPSRDLQEGAVISFGIIAIMQVPLVTLYIKQELSFLSSVWLVRACNATDYVADCVEWWAHVRVGSIASAAVSCTLHLVLIALCGYYVRTRPPTAQKLIANRQDKTTRRRMRAERRAREGKEDEESAFHRFEDKILRRKKKGSTKSSRSSADSPPPAPYADSTDSETPSRRASTTTSTLPAYAAPGAAPAQLDMHTDSGSDADKQLLVRQQ
ncbi:uncharacterized protein JCM10292_005874 [Rhodotorula paludigena]|uniref:uncharacterized protein n=1 Tax=Rhodotorula paludigena TaxID=86838 RepID=UPI003180EC44